MGKIKFSEQTIRAGFLVQTPDWYGYKITKHTEKPSDKGTINHFLIFEGKTGEMNGVPVVFMCNEKADWVALPLFKAALGNQDPDPNKEYDWDDLVGLELEAMTKRGEDQNGAPRNSLIEFSPKGTNVKEWRV